jgi:hypothetical protein
MKKSHVWAANLIFFILVETRWDQNTQGPETKKAGKACFLKNTAIGHS